ncbi:universal stress protein [Arthrobacter sp. LAPM80]|uniref:universal stress protein n=1 Tax=Arthrobacter sp. LAPM80 TaxID=3141788 RepID=UPI00398BA1CA
MANKQDIVVGVDQSSSSRAALAWGARRAERLRLGLLLVHVIPDYLVSPGNPEYRSVHDAIAGFLESEAGTARELAPAVHVQTRLVSGETVPVLVELSAGATMVVVGTDRTADSHGEGFGAVNLQLAMMGRCPVAVIPVQHTAVDAGVVVGIDGSAHSLAAAYFAADEAVETGKELTVIYAAGSSSGARMATRDDPTGRMILESTVSCLRARHIHLSVSDRFDSEDAPASALAGASQGAQMLVVGSRGRGAVQHAIMGSVTQDLLLHVPCPLILTRPAGRG